MSVLVLDIGSSSVRSSLWDEAGRSQGEAAQLEHRARAAPDGTAELDPEALFELVAQALDAAMEQRPRSRRSRSARCGTRCSGSTATGGR